MSVKTPVDEDRSARLKRENDRRVVAGLEDKVRATPRPRKAIERSLGTSDRREAEIKAMSYIQAHKGA